MISEEKLPPEPGTLAEFTLGLTDKEAGFPNPTPPANDKEIGDLEVIEGDGDDIDDEEEED